MNFHQVAQGEERAGHGERVRQRVKRWRRMEEKLAKLY
jgi:hypothetical protein